MVKEEYESSGNDQIEDCDSDHLCKLFIGGLDYHTNDEGLRSYFQKYGELVDVVVMKDPKTGCSRGFGFVAFSSPSMATAAQNDRPHVIDGRTVDTKHAIPKEDIRRPEKDGATNKIFIGGLSEDTEEEDVREVFSTYGNITVVTLPVDTVTQKKRGFGFVEFEDSDSVDKLCLLSRVPLRGRRVEVKRALSRRAMQNQSDGGSSRQNQSPWWKGDSRWNQSSSGSGGSSGGWRDDRDWGMGNSSNSHYGSSGYGPDQQSSSSYGYGNSSQWQDQPSCNSSWNSQQYSDGNYRSSHCDNWGNYDSSYRQPAGNSGMCGNDSPRDNFGNNYMQGYSGGPMRSQSGYGSGRPSPYNSGSGGSQMGSSYSYNNSGSGNSYGSYGGSGNNLPADRRF